MEVRGQDLAHGQSSPPWSIGSHHAVVGSRRDGLASILCRSDKGYSLPGSSLLIRPSEGNEAMSLLSDVPSGRGEGSVALGAPS